MQCRIPLEIVKVVQKLKTWGCEAFLVGGSVRDCLLGKDPHDWDVATNALPEEILKIFPDSFCENEFGTVGVKVSKDKLQKSKFQIQTEIQKNIEYEIVEVTTYRIESKYSDKRHPDEVKFAKTLEEDLSRRDFTVNAMAIRLKLKSTLLSGKGKKSEITAKNLALKEGEDFEIVDLFGGRDDLGKKVIRAVGNPEERFDEDALRMMRAVRFACQLNGNFKPQIAMANNKKSQDKKNPPDRSARQNLKAWEIEKETLEAIKKNAQNLKCISQERIRDELSKIILSDRPAQGIKLLDVCGLLEFVMPQLLQGKGLAQAHHHCFGPYREVFDHAVAALEKCPSKKLEVRLAALLHDIGKPATARGKGKNVTFYNHEYVGARIARKILEQLKYPRKIIDKVVLLVQNHMFYYNVSEVGEASVRRVVRKVGLENISDLIDVRIADRLGSGVPKAVPYKLRHFQFMVEKVSRDPISTKQLKINGNDLIGELKIKPGPKIGAILETLLAEVIEDPKINQKKKLLERARELDQENLDNLRQIAKKRIQKERRQEEEQMKKRYWVE